MPPFLMSVGCSSQLPTPPSPREGGVAAVTGGHHHGAAFFPRRAGKWGLLLLPEIVLLSNN